MAAGVQNTEAIDANQLRSIASGLTQQFNAYTDQQTAELQNDVSHVQNQLNGLIKDANAGTSVAPATASLLQSIGSEKCVVNPAAGCDEEETRVTYGIIEGTDGTQSIKGTEKASAAVSAPPYS